MAVFINDVKKWRALQINEVWLFFAAENYYLKNLKKGSTLQFTPILTDNDLGSQTTVGWKLTSKIIVVQNNYEELMPMLRIMAEPTNTPIFVGFELSNDKSLVDSVNDERLFFNFVSNNQEVKVKDFNITWDITQNDIAPELNIEIKGIFSKDIMNLTNLPIFKQYDWKEITW